MIYRCPQCGELFAADTVPLAQCAHCSTLLRVMPATLSAGDAIVAPPIIGPSWEQTGAAFPHRFVATCRQMLRSAPQFFYALGEHPSPRAEWFAYLAALIGIAGYFAGQLLLLNDTQAELGRFIESIAAAAGRHARPHGLQKLFGWGLALSPLLALLPAHLAAGLYHAGLFLLGQRPQSYELTFRVAAYGLAPIMLLAVPTLGVFVAPGWILALHWVGMAATHRLPLGVAFLSITLPCLTFFFLAARFLGQLLLLILTQQ